jgi:fatty acid desaturase
VSELKAYPMFGSGRADDYEGTLPARLPTAVLRDLSTISPLRSVAAIAAEWTAIIIAIVLYDRMLHPLLLPLVVIWIGARQHALAILMHEGAHYLLFKNRNLNMVVSELFLAWPLFITMRAYRPSHFAHHRHVNTPEDPDLMRKQSSEWQFPQSWRTLAALLVKDVLGLNTRQQLSEAVDLSDDKESRTRRLDAYGLTRALYYIVLLAAVTYFRLWPLFLLLWIIPIFTWLKMILRIRSIAEHFAVENDHVYTRTRTTLPSLFERIFVAPKNINFHIEHHQYPSVPWFRLPHLHALLMADPQFGSKAHVTSTYWGVLRECVGSR